MPILPREQVLAALNAYVTQVEQSLNHMLGRAEEQRPLPPFVEAMFGYSATLFEAEMKWIEEFMQQIKEDKV